MGKPSARGWAALLAPGLAGMLQLAGSLRSAADEPRPAPPSATRADHPAEASTERTRTAKGADATVVAAFRALCLECHDSDGRGTGIRDVFPKVPDFTAAAWQASRTDAELSRSIVEGKGKGMPRMKEKLGSIDVAQVVAFVRAFQGGKQVIAETAEEPPAAGGRSVAEPALTTDGSRRSGAPSPASQKLFKRYCAMCHGADGRGEPMRETFPGIPDFSNPRWHTTRRDGQLTASILDGKGSGMPAFRAKMPRAEARALVALVRGFAPQSPGAGAPARADDAQFRRRFQELEAELERLRKESRALGSDRSTPPAGEQPTDPAPPNTRP
jgi:mono/diheme cytochrome c family protein